MKRFFQKKRILHAVLWILLYVYAFNIGDSLNQRYHTSYVTPLFLILISVILIISIKRNPSLIDQGNRMVLKTKKESIILYLPLLVLAVLQFATGINETLGSKQIIAIIITMIGVGFIEEVLFRGLLLTSIKQKSNQKRAIIISGVTFGLGHIVNLTRGYDYSELITQIILAIVIGIALALLFVYTNKILPGILFHVVFNISGSLSVQSDKQKIILLIVMLVISFVYLVYLYHQLKKNYEQLNEVQLHTMKLTGEQ